MQKENKYIPNDGFAISEEDMKIRGFEIDTWSAKKNSNKVVSKF